jgi:hypothetical protein
MNNHRSHWYQGVGCAGGSAVQQDLLSLTLAMTLRAMAESANKNKNFFMVGPFISEFFNLKS